MSRSRAVVSRIAVCRDRRGDRGSRCVTLEDRGVSRLRIEDRGVANNYKRPKFCPVRRSIHFCHPHKQLSPTNTSNSPDTPIQVHSQVEQTPFNAQRDALRMCAAVNLELQYHHPNKMHKFCT